MAVVREKEIGTLEQMFGQSESYSKSLLARSLQKLQDARPGRDAAVEVENEH